MKARDAAQLGTGHVTYAAYERKGEIHGGKGRVRHRGEERSVERSFYRAIAA